MRHGHSFICSTGEAGSVSSTSDSTSDSTPASIAAQLGSAAAPNVRPASPSSSHATQRAASRRLQAAKPLAVASAARPARSATAQLLSSTHSIQYCDECVCSRACSGLCTVFVSLSVFSSIVFVASVRAILSLRVVMHRFKKQRDFSFPKRYASPRALYM